MAEQVSLDFVVEFKIGGAKLRFAEEDEFKALFKRFEGDELNYWNA